MKTLQLQAQIAKPVDQGVPFVDLVELGAEVAWEEAQANASVLRLQFGLWARQDEYLDKRIGEQYRVVGQRWADL